MAASKGMSVFVHNGTEYNINDPNVANEFSASSAYSAGDYVTYQGSLYRFTSAHSAGAWNSGHVSQVLVSNDVKALNSAVDKRVLYGTNTTITDDNKAEICNGTFNDLPNNKIYAVAGGTLTEGPFTAGYIQIITMGKSGVRTSGDMQIAIRISDNQIAYRTYYANTSSWSSWEYPGMWNITFAYSDSPITVAHSSSSTVITIPSTVRIMTPDGPVQPPAATLTIDQGRSSWITYDKTADEWVLSSAVSKHETYTIGWAGNGIKRSFIAGSVTETNSTAALKEWGCLFCPTTLPKLTFGASENTLVMPNCNISYSGGIITASAQTLTYSSPKWFGYDIDAGEFVLSSGVTGHTIIMLGALAASSKDNSYIVGAQLIIPKTIAFMGDSITAGSGTSKCFHQYIHDRYGFTCLNYAYGGSGWVRSFPNDTTQGLIGTGNEGRGVQMTVENQFTPNNILARLAELTPANLDGVVIAAGTNDWGHSNVISLSDFRSKVDETFEYYFQHFGLIPLLVMIPIHRINETNTLSPGTWTLMDFADALIEECRKYGVPYVDTMTMSGCQPNNEYNAAAFFARDDTHQSDGIHPNHYAHERMMRAIGETLNQLLKYDDKCMR